MNLGSIGAIKDSSQLAVLLVGVALTKFLLGMADSHRN